MTTIWLTGLPAAGKTTLGRELVASLRAMGHQAVLVDGDELRECFGGDLGFSPEDRLLNVTRAARIARWLSAQGTWVCCALVSPSRRHRDAARQILPDMFEVFVDCPAHVCAQRDPKGLWAQANAGRIQDFTGVGQAYERPDRPSYHYLSDEQELFDAVREILERMKVSPT